MRLPAQLLRRKKDACKNDFGHVLVLAGSPSMLGAAALTAKAALRSGAGLVSVGIPRSLNGVLQKKLPDEIMTRPLLETGEKTISFGSWPQIKKLLGKAQAVALGPGMSRNRSTQKLIRKLFYTTSLPMVIDADGLNALAGHLKKTRQVRILTPHPGEMARLAGITSPAVQRRRKFIAKNLAGKYNCIVVLKGNRTAIAEPGGKFYINKTGNPGMATAGSGDVLTGMLAALLGQGIEPFQAARSAVYLHGLAGDLAVKQKTQAGMIASDIIEKIPLAIKRCL